MDLGKTTAVLINNKLHKKNSFSNSNGFFCKLFLNTVFDK